MRTKPTMPTLADVTTRCSNYAGADHGDVSQPDWLLGPCGHHRDSDLVAESNWEVMLARYREIDPDGNDHEVHRFGHWGVGWVEEVAYRPGSAIATAADTMRDALESYPILNEGHHSALECAAVDESWESWQCADVRRDIVRELVSRISNPPEADDMSADEIEAWLDEVSSDALWDVVHDRGEMYDGSLHLSSRDIERAADALIAAR